MIGSSLEQQLRVLLSQANVARDVEHDQRLKVERRAAQMRGLLFEMAQRLLPNELDDLWKSTDVNDLPDDQLVRWMTSQLNAQVFECRALRNGRAADQVSRLQAALRDRDETIRQHDEQIGLLNAQLEQIAAFKERIRQLQSALDQAAKEKADLAADLDASRASVRRLRSQLDQSTNDAVENVSAVASQATGDTPDWYRAWLTETTPENAERHQTALRLVGGGEAFFRSEIIERLNALGLTNEPNPDKPTGTGARLLADLINFDFMTEINAGYGAAVPKPLQLTERGREAYRLLFGESIEETAFERLLKRHKTIEHTTLNLLARNVLKRFDFQAIEMFPDPLHTVFSALVDPDIIAVSPAGERLIIECERMTMRRTADERNAKWSHLAEVTHGQLYVVVFGNRQQSDLIAEISEWIHATRPTKVSLSACQYLKAINPAAPSVWTYTTTWAIA